MVHVTDTERDLFDWLLAQRILHAAGALTAQKVGQLDRAVPGWFTAPTAEELDRALASDHAELNEAITVWWQTSAPERASWSLADIRAAAAGADPDR